jgi:predicted DNA-binding protein (UPF0251 family)
LSGPATGPFFFLQGCINAGNFYTFHVAVLYFPPLAVHLVNDEPHRYRDSSRVISNGAGQLTPKRQFNMKAELQQYLQGILNRCEEDQFESPENFLKKEHEILNSYVLENQFITVFDIAKCDFAFVKPEVEKVLGYTPEEFTFNTLISIIPPEHLFFYLEFGVIAYELMATADNVKVLNHAYNVSCPFQKKGVQSLIILARKSYVFQLKDGIPATQLDIWEDITHQGSSEYFKWSIYSPSKEETISLNLDFYKRWKERIGTGFTPREIEALLLFAEGNPNKEIASKMNIAEDTVAEYFGNMKKKVKRVAQRLNTDRQLTRGLELHFDLPHYMTRNELLNYSLQFGLLPDNILKRHFLHQ